MFLLFGFKAFFLKKNYSFQVKKKKKKKEGYIYTENVFGEIQTLCKQ